MDSNEFAPVYKELCGAFGKDVTSSGATAMGKEIFKRYQDLMFKQFVDLCEAAKDVCDSFPSRKRLIEIATAKKLFDNAGDRKPNCPNAFLTPVECTCGRSFIVRDTEMDSFDTFDCPGKTYADPGGQAACNKSYAAGFLRDAKRASNGVIWIKDQPEWEIKYPSFLKD